MKREREVIIVVVFLLKHIGLQRNLITISVIKLSLDTYTQDGGKFFFHTVLFFFFQFSTNLAFLLFLLSIVTPYHKNYDVGKIPEKKDFLEDFMQYSDLSLSPCTNLHHSTRHGAADGKALEYGTN